MMSADLAAAQGELPRGPVAEGLFLQGKASLAAGRVAEACAKFEESQRLDPALGTLLNLALCHEAQGKVASAWSEWADAAAMAERLDQLDRVRFARAALAKLEGRVPKVVIHVTERAPELEVRVDGQPIGPAAWGSPIPLDPGVHRLEAAAPLRQSWARSFEVVAGASAVTLEVPSLGAMPAPRAGPASRVSPQHTSRKNSPRATILASAPQPVTHGTRRNWGYAASALAVAGFGLGTYFGLTAIAKQNIVEKNCDSAFCKNPEGMAADRAAHRAASAANVSFGVGLAAALASAYLLLTGHEDTQKNPTSHVGVPSLLSAPELSHRGARFEVSFAF